MVIVRNGHGSMAFGRRAAPPPRDGHGLATNRRKPAVFLPLARLLHPPLTPYTGAANETAAGALRARFACLPSGWLATVGGAGVPGGLGALMPGPWL